MKIKPPHVEHIRQHIQSYLDTVDLPSLIEKYETGNIPLAHTVRDLQIRFCWDCLNQADLWEFVESKIYPYANDDHVTTVLKRVCPKVTRRY